MLTEKIKSIKIVLCHSWQLLGGDFFFFFFFVMQVPGLSYDCWGIHFKEVFPSWLGKEQSAFPNWCSFVLEIWVDFNNWPIGLLLVFLYIKFLLLYFNFPMETVHYVYNNTSSVSIYCWALEDVMLSEISQRDISFMCLISKRLAHAHCNCGGRNQRISEEACQASVFVTFTIVPLSRSTSQGYAQN